MADLATLVERCRRGDDLAWEALVRRFQARIYGLAMHYVRDPEEARDLAQEIFVQVYRKLDTFRENENLVPWMLRVGRNMCIDRLRRIKARPPADDVSLDDGAEIVAPDPTPEDAADATGRRRLLYHALDGMSEKHREVILLKDIQGLKLDEIANLLHEPIGTIKSRSNRARIELASRVRALDPSYGT
ncbi:MAG: RNA polymerase sigma factor [Planctomycetota bacterium]